MSKFVKPELARSLIAAYNYRCRDEMCIIVAMMELLDNRIEMLFNKPKMKGSNDEINK